jgi:hypothetical protein
MTGSRKHTGTEQRWSSSSRMEPSHLSRCVQGAEQRHMQEYVNGDVIYAVMLQSNAISIMHIHGIHSMC